LNMWATTPSLPRRRGCRCAAQAGLLLAALACSCAPKIVPAPLVDVPKYPEFVVPVVPPGSNGGAVLTQDRGWRFLQVGDLKNAEHEFATALRVAPEFFPAETGLGYVELAGKDPKAALPHFEKTLTEQQNDLSALVGRGQALVALNRESEAVEAFEAALAVDPSMADIKRRVDVLRFRASEQDVARARQSAKSGKLDEAAAAYMRAITASPDSAFLYRELGAVERQKGDAPRALEHLRKAVALDAADAKSLVQIAEILESRGDLAAAEASYAAALAIEPSDVLEARIDAVRGRAELARMPEEYRAIPQAAQITRADLAALIGVRLAPLVQSIAERQHDDVLITDVRNNWAYAWIMAVSRAGVMELLPNHTFQPRTIVSRVDLAQAASRLLARIAASNPARTKSWDASRAKFTDLAPGHLAYPAASLTVAAGVIKLGPDNTFEPSRPVTGEEAMSAIGRIAALAGSTKAGQ
jgi:tetratricopeptide (TPR) repeat protein